MPVTVERDGAIAVVVVDNPPVNATSQAVRAGLAAAVAEVEGDPAIEAAVLLCAGCSCVARWVPPNGTWHSPPISIARIVVSRGDPAIPLLGRRLSCSSRGRAGGGAVGRSASPDRNHRGVTCDNVGYLGEHVGPMPSVE